MFKKRACQQVTEQLWAYAAQRLSEGERETVERHLHTCAVCRKEAEAFAVTVCLLNEFRAEPMPASQTNWLALRVELNARETTGLAVVQRPALRALWLPPSLALCGAACTLAIGLLAWHSIPRSNTPVSVVENPSPTPNPLIVRSGPPMIASSQKKTKAGQQTALRSVSPISESAANESGKRDGGSGHLTMRLHYQRRHRRQFVRQPIPPAPIAPTPALHTQPKTQMALNVDGESVVMPVLPVNYVMPAVETVANLNSPHRYVIGQIPAASPSATTQTAANTKEELQPW